MEKTKDQGLGQGSLVLIWEWQVEAQGDKSSNISRSYLSAGFAINTPYSSKTNPLLLTWMGEEEIEKLSKKNIFHLRLIKRGPESYFYPPPQKQGHMRSVEAAALPIIWIGQESLLHMRFYQRIYAVLMELCWARTDPKVVLDWVRDVVNPITIWRIIYALWRLKTIVMLMLRFFCRRVYMLIGRVQKVILPSKMNIK